MRYINTSMPAIGTVYAKVIKREQFNYWVDNPDDMSDDDMPDNINRPISYHLGLNVIPDDKMIYFYDCNQFVNYLHDGTMLVYIMLPAN